MTWLELPVCVSTQRNGGQVSKGDGLGVEKKPLPGGQEGVVLNLFEAYAGRWQPVTISDLRFEIMGSQSMYARWLELSPRLNAIGGSSWSRASPAARPRSTT